MHEASKVLPTWYVGFQAEPTDFPGTHKGLRWVGRRDSEILSDLGNVDELLRIYPLKSSKLSRLVLVPAMMRSIALFKWRCCRLAVRIH